MNIGEAIKDMRKLLGLTQMQLAKEMHVAFSTVNRWENNRIIPNGMARALLSDFMSKNGIDEKLIRVIKKFESSPVPIHIDRGLAPLVYDKKERGNMIRIVTDTGSDITYLGASALGMESLELSITFSEFPYDVRNDTDFSIFYENLVKAKNLPTTSQVTPAQYLDVFNDAKEKGHDVLVITLSGGLSGTYQSALMAKEECDYDRIVVIDSRQAIMPQRALAEHAVKLRDEGKNLAEIEQVILDLKERLVVFGMLDTLTYLKKGGRVPPAMALIGNVLNIKPVIILRGGVLEPLGKVRGSQAGKQTLWKQLEKDGYDESWPIYFGHINCEARCKEFMQETIDKFGLKKESCIMYPIGGIIGTHLGPGSLLLSCVKKAV